MSRVESIVHTPLDVPPRPADHYARVPLQEANLIAGRGIEGDRKGTNAQRQLNVMAAEILAQLTSEGFKTNPGEMGEQIVVSGVEWTRLVAGARLRIGPEAIIRVAIPRTGCDRFEHIQGRPKATVAGRLGVMATVEVGGTIRVGDPVTILEAERGSRDS